MNESSNTYEKHFKNLVALAYSDKYISPEETRFLKDKAASYSISDKVFYDTIEEAKRLRLNEPQGLPEAKKQLTDFIYMSVMDGILRTNEYELCIWLGLKLGYEKLEVEKIIRDTSKDWLVQNDVRW